jgi:hypothetical protein
MSTVRIQRPRKGPIQASVADLLGLCKEFGLDLGERKVSKETWLREIATADPRGDRYRSLKLEDILCCECYMRKSPNGAARLRFGQPFPLTDTEIARAELFKAFAEKQKEKMVLA